MLANDDPWIIITYLLFTLSATCSAYVLLNINYFHNFQERLLVITHVILIILDITLLPDIFTGSTESCQFFGYLYYYSRLANVIAVNLKGLECFRVLSNNLEMGKHLRRYSEMYTFLLPLIPLLPLFAARVNCVSVDGVFCALPSDLSSSPAGVTFLVLFYIMSWFLLIFPGVAIIVLLRREIRRGPEGIAELITRPVRLVIGYYLLTVIGQLPDELTFFIAIFVPTIYDDHGKAGLIVVLPYYFIGIGGFLLFLFTPKYAAEDHLSRNGSASKDNFDASSEYLLLGTEEELQSQVSSKGETLSIDAGVNRFG